MNINEEIDMAIKRVSEWINRSAAQNIRAMREAVTPVPTANKFSEYQRLATRTAKDMDTTGNLLHAALGIAGEAGEFADCVKKHWAYGKPLDYKNAAEEIGDVLWYCALAANALHMDLGRIAEMNIEKLRTRYPEKYTDEHAAARLDKVGE